VQAALSGGAELVALSDIRAGADASFPGLVHLEVDVRVWDVTGCHPMSLAV
jgi:hypothetical protein